jgi:transcriptional regulator
VYVPRFNSVDEEVEVRAIVADAKVGWLVTIDGDGTPEATLLPIMWRDDTVVAHMARANRQWRTMQPEARALVIVTGPDAYVSPSWYASKAEHGRVVPTWNYTAVHLTGTARVRLEPGWLRQAVSELTEVHEGGRAAPWWVSDAPAEYIEAQLRGIVGIELAVERVDAKAKLSQNRSDADRAGVIDGLSSEGDPDAAAIAEAMHDLRL